MPKKALGDHRISLALSGVDEKNEKKLDVLGPDFASYDQKRSLWALLDRCFGWQGVTVKPRA